MTETADRLRGATRWSMASRCSRMASYGLLGVEPVPPTARQQGRFARGRDAGRYFARQMELKHGAENVMFEYAVPWPKAPAIPVGELHVDCALLTDKIAIEVKNSKWVDSMYDAAVVQVAGALYNAPDKFESGLVVFMDGDYQITHEFPVFLTDELVETIEKIMADVVAAGQHGTIPERVCEKPADGIGHFCPFIEHCFAGWEKPQDELWPNPQLASEGWVILRDLRTARGSVEELEERWDEWKAKAIEAEVPLGPSLAGGIEVKRTDVRGRETFSMSKAKKAGMWTPLDDERFGPFVNISDGHSTFDITKTEGTPLDLDFGDASHLDDI